MPGVVADYVKQEEHEKQQELEWRERETEHIPAWRDEERITAARYEEGVYTDEELEKFAEEPFAHWREEDFENEAIAERMRPF